MINVKSLVCCWPLKGGLKQILTFFSSIKVRTSHWNCRVQFVALWMHFDLWLLKKFRSAEIHSMRFLCLEKSPERDFHAHVSEILCFDFRDLFQIAWIQILNLPGSFTHLSLPRGDSFCDKPQAEIENNERFPGASSVCQSALHLRLQKWSNCKFLN